MTSGYSTCRSMTADRDYIKLSPFPQARIETFRQQFTQCYFSNVQGGRLDVDRFAAQVAEILKLNTNTVRLAVMTSVEDEPLQTESQVRRAMYRLAANFKRLRRGLACPLQTENVGVHWARAWIAGMEALPQQQGREMRMKLAFRVLSGPLAGSQVYDICRVKAAAAIYTTLTERPRRCRYQTPWQLTQLRCVLLLSMAGGDSRIDKVTVTAAMVAANAKLTRLRSRQLHRCPFGRSHDCAACPVGMNECGLSVIPLDTKLLQRKD